MASWRAPAPRKASTFRACDAKEESSPKPKSKSKSKSKSAKNHASVNTTIATLSCFPKSANLDVMLGKMNLWCYLRGTRNQMLFKPDLCFNLREDLFNRLNFLFEFPPSPIEDDSALPTFKAFCDDTTIFEEYDTKTIGKYIAWFYGKVVRSLRVCLGGKVISYGSGQRLTNDRGRACGEAEGGGVQPEGVLVGCWGGD